MKKARLIKTITDKYEMNVDVFELTETDGEKSTVKYVTGTFVREVPLSLAAFYYSDTNGELSDNSSLGIMEEGFNNYRDLFAHLGYILL